MVNELEQLLRENVATAPPDDDIDVSAVLRIGRRQARARRVGVMGGAAALLAAVVATVTVIGGGLGDGPGPAAERDRLAPLGPVLTLADARPAVEDSDYRVLAAHTNDNLELANGQYLAGVTDDGLVVFTDGPHTLANSTRVALLDPATGEKDWLPGGPQQIEQPIVFGEDSLVFQGQVHSHEDFAVRVFDRVTRSWSSMEWPALPRAELLQVPQEHDGRLYVALDPDSDLQRFDLWSVSLTDPADVRNEETVVGDFDITGDELTWTATHNEPNDRIHVRDLATGEEHDFDPRSGDRCNQLGMQRVGDLLALGQYCGTDGGVRDDRVQVITMDGEPVATLQDDNIDMGRAGGSLVMINSYHPRRGGAFAYDPESGDLVRFSERISNYALGGPVPPGSPYLLWHTPVNQRHGATQWLGEWLG